MTAEDVPNIIQKEPNLVIMVYANWCGYCQKMKPNFEQAAKQLQHQCTWARLDGDQFSDAAKALGVESFPTTLHFRNGQLVKPLRGAMETEKLVAQVQ